MVWQFHIAAINDVDASRDFAEPLAPTKEAQESRLTQMYGEALSCLQHGQIENAQSLFQSILQDPISIKAQVWFALPWRFNYFRLSCLTA
jgi:calcineurin-binding protein cabin-1